MNEEYICCHLFLEMLGTVGDNPVYNAHHERQFWGICLARQSSLDLHPQRTFTRQEIKKHNTEVGWNQWVTLRGNVYDVTALREHFLDFIQRKKEACATEKSRRVERDAFRDSDECGVTPKGGVTQKGAGFCPQNGSNDCRGNGKYSWSPKNATLTFCRKGEDNSMQNDIHAELREHPGVCGTNSSNLWNRVHPSLTSYNGSDSDIDTSEDDENDDCLADDEDDSDRGIWATTDNNHGEVIDGDAADSRTDAILPNVPSVLHHDVISALHKSGLTDSEMEAEMRPYHIGVIENVPSWRFWQSFRADVMGLIGDLNEQETNGSLGQYEREYLTQLQRWLRKYIDIDPPVKPQHVGDPNTSVFVLPADPFSLRQWLEDWEPFDTSLPKTGAWQVAEQHDLSPLASADEVFAASLRAHFSQSGGFHFDIAGEAAWDVLPSDIISNDQMTVKQQAVHDSRMQQKDPCNPDRICRRRAKLGAYFRHKYKLSEDEMMKFLRWADIMEKNKNELDELCVSDAQVCGCIDELNPPMP